MRNCCAIEGFDGSTNLGWRHESQGVAGHAAVSWLISSRTAATREYCRDPRDELRNVGRVARVLARCWRGVDEVRDENETSAQMTAGL